LPKRVAMLSKKFDEMFVRSKLLEIVELYSKDREYRETKEMILSGKFNKSLSDGFIPEPLQGFEIPKDSGEMRQLAKASLS